MIPNRLKQISWLAVLLVLCITGCSAIGLGKSATTQTVTIQSGREVGQTVFAYWDGLNEISFYVTPIEGPPRSVIVSLYEDAAAEMPLGRQEIADPGIRRPGWVRFPLELQRESVGKSFFVTIETESDGPFALATVPARYYSEGSLYMNRAPENRNIEFHLHYSEFWAVAGLFRDMVPLLGILAAAGFLFTVPGWAIFSAFWNGWDGQAVHNKIFLATALGLSVYPVLLLWARVVRLEVLPFLVWGVPGTAVASFLVRYRRRSWRPAMPRLRLEPSAILFYGFLLAVLVTRFAPLRFLDVGMWGDSYHHTLITQLILDHGGLFASWEPYAPLITFTYHFGFHVGAALMSKATGAAAHETVLWMGQLHNFLAVFGLVSIADAVQDGIRRGQMSAERRYWLAIVMLVVVGLFERHPMFYINWGRYTQLAGQVLLPAFIVFSIRYFQSEKREWKETAIGWMLLAGLGLTHYRVLLFAMVWLCVYWLFFLKQWWKLVSRTWWLGIGAVLLILPWFLIVYGGYLVDILQFQVSTPAAEAGEVLGYYNAVGPLGNYLSYSTWALSAAFIAWALARRDRGVLMLALWAVLLVLMANPAMLGLPGTGIVNNLAILIVMYIPAGLVLGFGSLWLFEAIRPRFPVLRSPDAGWAFAAGFLAISTFGLLRQVDNIKTASYELVTNSDRIAFEWVQENIPSDALFFVNYFAAEGGNTVAGSDAGWWLPYFTGRETVLPPFILISEVTKPVDLREQLLALDERVLALTMDNPTTFQGLKELGVTHLYIGQRQGSVWSQGKSIDMDSILGSDYYRLLFQKDRVYVFELVADRP